MFSLHEKDPKKYNSQYFSQLYDVPNHIINNIFESVRIPKIVSDPNNKTSIYGI